MFINLIQCLKLNSILQNNELIRLWNSVSRECTTQASTHVLVFYL